MKQSAGILLYKTQNRKLYVLLIHPGGPYFEKKDTGVWSIPKGELEEREDALTGAKREFFEETGHVITNEAIPLKTVKQKSGKLVHAWAVEGEMDVTKLVSNFFEMEWPLHSGKRQSFAEVDRAEWFSLQKANEKIIPAQREFLKELQGILKLE